MSNKKVPTGKNQYGVFKPFDGSKSPLGKYKKFKGESEQEIDDELEWTKQREEESIDDFMFDYNE